MAISLVLMLLVVAVVAILILLAIVVLVFACRRWQGRRSSAAAASASNEADDLSRPLVSENLDNYSHQISRLSRSNVDEPVHQVDRSNTSPRTDTIVHAEIIHHTEAQLIQGDTHVIDVTYDTSEDFQLGSTLKRTVVNSWPSPDAKHIRSGSSGEGEQFINRNGKSRSNFVKDAAAFLRSSLTLEVIAGPALGVSCSRQSTNTTMLPLTLGRVPPSDLVLKDSEVSGKHARINWNPTTLRWELVDMGSLNGTFLNSETVHHADGSRQWSEPVELADGDIVTLGTSSKVSVKILQQNQQQIPAGVGVASDPMTARRAGKKLPMEDMCFCQYPLADLEQFGLFGIFDGHGGDGASKAASKMLPDNIAKLLSQMETKEKVLSSSEATDVLKNAFSLTEAELDHQYEGCTATALLFWFDCNKECFVQCANVGDSACVLSVDGKLIAMTEDHRVTSLPERTRMAAVGEPLKDGETRLAGLNLGRMLGDKFLKEQDARFSSEPYISQVVHITKACTAFALIASDGLWDVISLRKAVQLVLESKEDGSGNKNSAEKIAKNVLNEARTQRTKDNTSVIYIDFDILRTDLPI